MQAHFVKMHGLGNDFVIFDERAGPLGITPARAAALADRRTGIGCDQLICLGPAADAAATMRIYNPDGSLAEACGNATRCVADLLFRATRNPHQTLHTAAGTLAAEIGPDGAIAVDMGTPSLAWDQIPLARQTDTLHLPIAAGPLTNAAACAIGNPHATFFVDHLAAVSLHTLGPALEHDPLFPQRANIGVAQVLAPDCIQLRVWERGAGLTRACGSGACAAVVNAARRNLTHRAVTVLLDGGTLHVEWRQDGHVIMTGPSVLVFRGSIDLAGFPP